MKRLLPKLLLSILFLGIVSCASSVKRTDYAASYTYNGEKYRTVELTVSDTATKKLEHRERFDEAALRDLMEQKLEVAGLLAESSANNIKVEINDVRVRSSFSAVMWGFMAGNDHIRGRVSIVGENGVPTHSFDVSAAYALGGFVGGEKETRMGWLYEKFSELALNEILGEGDTAAK